VDVVEGHLGLIVIVTKCSSYKRPADRRRW